MEGEKGEGKGHENSLKIVSPCILTVLSAHHKACGKAAASDVSFYTFQRENEPRASELAL